MARQRKGEGWGKGVARKGRNIVTLNDTSIFGKQFRTCVRKGGWESEQGRRDEREESVLIKRGKGKRGRANNSESDLESV